MKHQLLVLSVVGCLASSALGLDREAFTFAKYDLDVRVDPQQQRLGVRGRIALRNDSASPQKVAVLQISSTLNWRSILAEHDPLQFVSQPYTSDIDHTGELSEAVITLPRAVKPNESIELEVGYEGVIPLNAARLTRIGTPDPAARNSDWDQISPSFTAVRGVGQVTWYPVALEAASLSQGNSVFAAVARWKSRETHAEMKITLHLEGEEESSPQVLCNDSHGANIAADHEKTNVVTCNYAPLGITVPSFVFADYDTLARGAGNFLFLPNHKQEAEEYSSAADLALPLIQDWIGEPKTKLTVLELPDAGAAPFETANLMLMPFAHPDVGLARITLVHGLAHAAFSSRRPWISEGIAHFMQALEREQLAGRKAALDYMGLHRAAFVAAEQPTGAAKSNDSGLQPLLSTFDETFYRSKSMYVWWMLRDMIGDPALKRVLHAYDSARDNDPKYLETLVAAESKRDLSWFFNDWVYNDKGLPEFHVASAFARKTDKGSYLLTVTIENTGIAGAEVPIIVTYGGGEIAQRLEVRGKANTTTRVEVPGVPEEIVVNDGSVPESDLSNDHFKVAAQ